jgi:hypothetical protein
MGTGTAADMTMITMATMAGATTADVAVVAEMVDMTMTLDSPATPLIPGTARDKAGSCATTARVTPARLKTATGISVP